MSDYTKDESFPRPGHRQDKRQEMTARTFVFDAYGTLFDVHAAIGRHRAACGPDAERMSEIWRMP